MSVTPRIPNHYPAPAKINMVLSVGPPQSDRRLHPICSWMNRISLYDDLLVERLADDEPSRFQIGWADDAPCPSPIDWPIESDLTCLACQWMEQTIGRPLPVAVRLAKRAPVGAGLGGGSGNAAAMLKALIDLFDLQLPADLLIRIASQLGSDVPFFLGPPSAIVSGFGETLEPAPIPKPMWLTLIMPKLSCNTGAVYRKFDELHPDAALRPEAVRSIVANERIDERWLFNDLADAAMAVEPRLAELRERCRNVVGRRVHVTGSGAAMFCLCGDESDARLQAERLTGELGVASRAVLTGAL